MALLEREQPELSLTTQCDLLSLNRTSLYYQPVPPSAKELALKRRIDELYTAYPFYGSRKIAVVLGLNRKLAGATIFRTAYFAPFITTLTAAALLWQWIFDPSRGLIDSFLYMIGTRVQ